MKLGRYFFFGSVNVCAGTKQKRKTRDFAQFGCRCIFVVSCDTCLVFDLTACVLLHFSSRKSTPIVCSVLSSWTTTHLFTHCTVVKTSLIIDRRSLLHGLPAERTLIRNIIVTMKTDWNETFRFDEEETELAQNTIETYDCVKRKFNEVNSFKRQKQIRAR